MNFPLDNTPNNRYTTPMTTITAFKLPTDLDTPGCPVQIRYTRDHGVLLNDMYAELDCDLVEVVLSTAFPQTAVWCDEEALCKGDPELNLRASIIAGRPIYGPVVIVSENAQQYSRSWSPDNPLPWIPCELDRLAQQIMTTGKVTLRY